MSAPGPADLRLLFHHSLSDSYELSQVLLAIADFDGTLQLLTSGWERALGYGRDELHGKTLGDLIAQPGRSAAAAAAILDRANEQPVELSLRCRNGARKRFRLHRRYDRHEQRIYLVAEELLCAPGNRPAATRLVP